MTPALQVALTAFEAEEPRFVSHSENEVHEVRHRGRRAALRLHRPGYQERDEIWSELWWMRALAQAGLPVPEALPTPDGALIVDLPGGQRASMVGWVEGGPITDAMADAAVFHRIGALLARLHEATDALALPARFRRHAWDAEGLIGAAPLWGRFWENPALAPDERRTILAARARLRAALDAYRADGGDFGLIHADPIRGNVLVEGERVTLIDFDDAGFGFRAYDLAVLMTQNEHLPNADALLRAAIAGYRSVRPFSRRSEALLPGLILARRLASAGWIVPRSQEGDPRRRYFAERALEAAERYLAGLRR